MLHEEIKRHDAKRDRAHAVRRNTPREKKND